MSIFSKIIPASIDKGSRADVTDAESSAPVFDIESRVKANRYKDTTSFETQAVKYISGLLMLDGKLLPRKFKIYNDFLIKFFGKDKIEAGVDEECIELRQFAFECLLNEEKSQIKFQDIIELANGQIEDEKKDALGYYAYKAFRTLTHKVSDEYIEDVENIPEKWKNSVSEKDKNIIGFMEALPPKPADHDGSSMLNGGFSAIPFANQLLPGEEKNETVDNITELKEAIKLTKSVRLLIDQLNYLTMDNREVKKLTKDLKEETNDARDSAAIEIAVIGEAKQGKSSFVNKVLGSALSPVGEALPTTGTVVAFQRSSRETPEVILLNDEDERNHRKALLKNSGKNDLAIVIDHMPERKQTVDSNISKYIDMQDKDKSFLRAKQVIIPVNKDFFGERFILKDTPAFNSTLQTINESAWEAASRASKLVFVTSALHSITNSEKKFLLDAIEKGRASELIIVVTHTDLLKNKNILKGIELEIKDVLESVTDEARYLIKDPAFFSINTGNDTGGKEIKNITKSLFCIPENHDIELKTINLLKKKRHELANKAHGEFDQHIEEIEKYLGMLGLLKTTAVQCDNVTQKYLEQLKLRIEELYRKLNKEFSEIKEYLNSQKKEIVQAFSSIVDEGMQWKDYWQKSTWENFIDHRKPEETLKKYEIELNEKIKSNIDAWEKSTKDFNNDISEIINPFTSEFSKIDVEKAFEKTKALTGAGYVMNELAGSINKSLSTAAIAVGGAALMNPSIVLGAVLSVCSAHPAVAVVAIGATVISKTINVMGLLSEKKIALKFKKEKMEAFKKKIDPCFEDFNNKIEQFYQELGKELWDNFCEKYYSEVRGIYVSNKELLCQITVLERMTEDVHEYGKEAFSLVNGLKDGKMNPKTLAPYALKG